MTEPTRSRDRYHDATMSEVENYREGAEDMRAAIVERLTAAGLTAAAAMVTSVPRPGPQEPFTGLHVRGG